ncbi:MAG: SBBP repeat-containing protein [Planctomycetota bacterium]
MTFSRIMKLTIPAAAIFAELFLVISISAQSGSGIPRAEAWPRVPVAFEENAGQFGSDILYYSRRGGLDAFLTNDGFILRFLRIANDTPDDTKAGGALERMNPGPPPNARVQGAALRFRFVGASAAAHASGELPLDGKVNYLIGNDSSKWLRNIATYGAVRFRGILPGVDAVYYEQAGLQGGNIKYDLLVDGGVSAETVILECEGSDSLEIAGDGSLIAKTAMGEFRQARPVTFEILNNSQRVEVPAKYRILGKNRIGFDISRTDASRKLVIDPGFTFATFLGGSGIDSAQDIAVDASGNSFVTGFASSTNFPITAGAFDIIANGNFDAFITKIKADGSGLLFSTYLGGNNADQGTGIAIDGTGNVYVSGSTLSINFPVSVTAHDKTWGFGAQVGDGFVTKLSSDGDLVIASTFVGGSGDDLALRVGIDTQLNVYVTGWTRSSSLDFPTNNGFQTVYGGNAGLDLGDAFLIRYNSTLSGVAYGTYLGGSSNDGASGLAVDAVTGKAYICGLARAGFPTKALSGSNALKPTIKANGDAFIACIDTTLAANASLIFSGFHGGAGIDSALDVAVGPANSIFACGYTESPDLPSFAGSFDVNYNNSQGKPGDGWVMKLNSTGTQFAYSTFLGGNSQDAALSLAIDAAGSAYVCGRTFSSDFPRINGGFDMTYNGKTDGFAAKFNPGGTAITMATFIGGTNDDVVNAIALLATNDVYLCGTTLSPFIPVSSGFDTSINVQDAFVVRIDLGPVPRICADPETEIVVLHNFGEPGFDFSAINILNCGSPDSTLNFTITESLIDVPWLAESANVGSVVFGATPATIDLTFDSTGLPLGSVTTTLQIQNTNDLDEIVEIPVLFVIENGTVTPFESGDTLSGVIDFQGESDIGSFTALKGMTLQIGVTVTLGDLKPIVELIDENDIVIKTHLLKNSANLQKKMFTFTADGDYRIRFRGVGATTGSFTCTTKLKLPKDAKSFTKKNAVPKVNGLPVDFKIRLLAGALLNFTVDPTTPITGPLAISLFDPDEAVINIAPFTQVFGTDGLQCANFPATAAGQYTVRVTGLATKLEKATVAITPAQPAGGAQVVLP